MHKKLPLCERLFSVPSEDSSETIEGKKKPEGRKKEILGVSNVRYV